MAARLTAAQRDERLAFIEAQRAAGVTFKEISRLLGKNEGATWTWYVSAKRGTSKSIPTPLMEAQKNGPRMTRPCARCGRAFESMRADGAWLRRCGACHNTEQDVSPMTPNPGGDTGKRRMARR